MQLCLFPSDRQPPQAVEHVQIRMDKLVLKRPRQWGACWLAMELWARLHLDAFWGPRLPASREGTRWLNVLKTLVTYRLIDPGSEFRLHRLWYDRTAMADLLGEDFRPAAKENLYRCLDKLLQHRDDLFNHLMPQWKDLFGARFEVLLYDLTSTYFEIDPPDPATSKRRHGYSRDKRSDCVQVVIALVVTPEGFPLGYEVMAGNTSDKTTLRGFLKKIQTQYGKADRIWVMDRGIPTEEVLAEMRASDPPVSYLVGTPKGRLGKLEGQLVDLPWQKVREGIEVKLLPKEGELYVFAQSRDRIGKERAMRRRALRKLLKRLAKLRGMSLKRDELLLKIGAAKEEAGRAFNLVDIHLPRSRESVNEETFFFSLNRGKLRIAYRREGRYLLRSNLCGDAPVKLWELYIQLTQIEEAFKNLKGDLALRPIHHQLEGRIEAHIFIAFVAYCVQVTLSRRLRDLAPGLTARSVLEKFAAMQMIDVHFPTTDGRKLILSRYTQPEEELLLLLRRLKLQLPEQPRPRITADHRLEQ